MALIHYVSGTRIPLYQVFFLASILLWATVGFYISFRQKLSKDLPGLSPKNLDPQLRSMRAKILLALVRLGEEESREDDLGLSTWMGGAFLVYLRKKY